MNPLETEPTPYAGGVKCLYWFRHPEIERGKMFGTGVAPERLVWSRLIVLSGFAEVLAHPWFA